MKSRFFRWIGYWMGLERAPGRRVGRQRLAVEMLEDRVTPSVDWVGSNADWSASVNNWLDTADNSHHFPTTGNDVRIENGATVSFNTTVEINALTIGNTSALRIGSGTLTIDSDSTLDGGVTMPGGTLNIGDAAADVVHAATFTLSGGLLQGPGNLITSGLFTWTGGDMAGSGQTTTNGSLAITCDNGSTLDGRTLNINGGATLTGVGSQLLRAVNGAVVNNAGLFDVLSDVIFFEPDGSSSHPTFNNLATGTFRKSAGNGTTIIQVPFNNSGAVEVNSGTVNLSSGGTSTGSFTVAATTTLAFRGGTHNLILNAGSSISGAGTVRFSGSATNLNGGTYSASNTVIAAGTANFNVNSSTTTFSMTNGTLGGSGNFTVSGASTWTGGDMIGSGQTTTNGSLAITCDNGSTLDERTLNINGGATLTGVGSNLLRAENGAVVNNAGLFDVLSDVIFFEPPGPPPHPTFNNLATGTFRKSAGNGTTTVSIPFNNLGTVEARSGTLNLNNVAQFNAGTATLNGGTWNVFTNSTLTVNGGGAFTNNTNITLDGANSVFTGLTHNGAAGVFTIQNGRNFNPSVAFNNAGLVNIGAGTTFTLTNGGTSTGDWDVAATGTLLFSGTTASYLLDDGTDITGAGSATVLGGTVNAGDAAADAININNFTINQNATLTANGALHATGNLTLGGSGDGTTLNGPGAVTIDGFFSWQSGIMSGNGTTIATTIANGGINLGGNLTLDGRQLDNAGTATWTAGGIGFEHGAVFNNGSVFNHNAVFDAKVFNGSISHTIGAAPAFNNFGTFKKTGDSDSTITTLVPFNNNGGTVDVQTGTLLLRTGGTSTGPWTVAAPAVLDFADGNWDLKAGSTVSGAGIGRFEFVVVNLSDTYTVDHTDFKFDGAVNFNADSNTKTLALTNGTLGGSGNFTVADSLTWQSGRMTGAGTTFVNGDLTLNTFFGPGLNGRRLDNNGTATWIGSGFALSNGAIFNNNGTFDDQVDNSISDDGGAQSLFNNNGTFRKSALSGTTTILVAFTNNGTIDVQTGTVSLNGPSGGLTNFPIASTVAIDSSPTGATESGTTVTITRSNGGHQFLVVGQTVTISGVAEPGYNGTFTVTAVPSQLKFQYTAVSGLPDSGGGSATFLSDSTLTGGTYLISGKLQFTDANIVTNAANIVLNGPASAILNKSTSTDALANFATNAATGSITIQNGRNFTTTGAFSNAGNVTVGAGSTFALPNANTYTQTAGTTNLLAANSTLNPGTLADIQGGILAGIGTVQGSVLNAGQVNPGNSAGVLTVTGDYTQNAAGVLNVQIGGTNASTPDFDQLHVAGAANLGGTLNLTEIGGFHPALNDHYPIVTYASATGDFATKNGFFLGHALYFKEQFNATDLSLVVNQAQLKFQVQPTETTVGIPIQVKVEVDDDAGALLADDNVDQVTVTLNQNTFSDSTTSKTLTVVNGVATFNLTINQAATGYQLTAGQNGFADVLSSMFTVNPPVALNPTALTDSTVGVLYNKFVTASNGTGNKTMQVSNFSAGGTGLTSPGISANTITFNSTPTAAGTVSFDLLAPDTVGATASQHYSFTINPAVTVSPTTLPDSTVGVLYNKVITASNGTGNKTMQVSNYDAGGTGLAAPSPSANTLTFNLIPSAAGVVSFDLLATDTVGATASQHYSFTINPAISFSPTTLAASTVNILYNRTITALGGTGAKTLQVSNYNSGGTGLVAPSASPDTLTFNSTPTIAGAVNFDVTATDSVGATSVLHYTVTINAAVSLSPTSMPAGAIGTPYNQTITASNGTGTKSMQVSNFDDGGTGLASPVAGPNTLTFNSTPTASGTASFDVTATDTLGATGFRHYTIDVSRVSLTPATLPGSTVGILYDKTITASNGIGDITMVVSNYSDGGTGIASPSTSPNTVTFNSTPSAAGTVEFDLSATDTIGANTAQHYSFVINPAIALSPLTLPDSTVGVLYDKVVTASNGTGTKFMQVSNYDDGGTGLASPGTGANTVTFNSTPTAAGTVSFDLLATDAVGAMAAQHYSFTINPAVTIDPTTLSDSTAGVLYNKVITASNGTGNKSMQISHYDDGGTGLASPGTSANTVTFNSTPSAAGTVNFDLLATDTAGGMASQHYSITINAAVSLSPTTLPDSTAGVLYNKVVTALNGTGIKTMQLSNYDDGGTGLAAPTTNPNALTFNGTPTSAGTVSFDLLATDTVGAPASQHYSFTINAAVSLSPTTLPDSTAGVLYNKVITASNGTGNKIMSVTNYNAGGTGLASPGTSANTVTFNSTPTAAGTVSFDLLATDTVGATASQHYSFTINAAVNLSPTTLPDGTAGVLYNKVITASNGTGNKTMSVTNYNAGGTGLASPGISLNSVTFNSTPSAAGTVSFDLLATDTVGATASLHYSFTINAAVSLSPTILPDTTVGVLYNKVITASNGTGNKTMSVTNYNAGGTGLASPGISLNSVTFNSTPGAAGTVSFDLLATDAVGGTASLHYSFTINAAVSLSPTTLPDSTAGVLYNKVITASNGTGNKTMSVTNYNAGGTGLSSPGISLNTVTFNSTPGTAGTVSFDLLATDAVGGTASLHYSFTINAAVSLNPTTLPNGTANTLYSQTITALGGTGNKTMQVTNYSAGGTGLAAPTPGPNTVTFNSTPNAGAVSFDVVATDTAGGTATLHYSFTINPGGFPVSDTFTQADGTPLAAIWTTQVGTFIVNSNQATGTNGLDLATIGGVGGANVIVQADVTLPTGVSSQVGLVARYSGSGDSADMYWGFLFRIGATTFAAIYRHNNSTNTWTGLAGPTIPGNPLSGKLRFEVIDSALTLKLNGVTVASVTDTSAQAITAPGLVGVRAILSTKFDNFSGKEVITDTFTQTNGTPLNSNLWTMQSGSLTVQGNRAVSGTATLNRATLKGVSQGDVRLEADVTLGTGGQIGLTVRNNGADYYYATLSDSGGNTYAVIRRYTASGFTTLSSPILVAGKPKSGRLRFEVVGTSLKLSLNGRLLVSVTNNALTTGGVGMLAIGGGTFDNYREIPLA